jgi:hypothetical protein
LSTIHFREDGEMKEHAGIKRSLFVVDGIVFSLALRVLAPTLTLSQPVRQSSLLSTNYWETGVEIHATLTGTEIISIDLAGPDGAIKHTEPKESPVLLNPLLGASDGACSYREFPDRGRMEW